MADASAPSSASDQDLASQARAVGHCLLGLAELADKYQALAELGRGVPGRTIERRDAMREVAARFPAALREFDQVAQEDLAQRGQVIRATLEAILSDVEQSVGYLRFLSKEQTWVRASMELHAYLRELLRIKQWLSDRALPSSSEEMQAAFAKWHAACCGNSRWPASYWQSRLDQIANPPQAKLTQIAFEDVALRHGMKPDELRQILFAGKTEDVP